MRSLTYWSDALRSYQISTAYPDDAHALQVCQLALQGAQSGNVGVGAILLNPDGKLILARHNEVCQAGFRSDLHAEMVLMNAFETAQSSKLDLSGHTLVSSLEPCPMCMSRLIFAGVGHTIYVCPDPDGGMVQLQTQLPPVFQQFMTDQNQQWSLADCSPTLQQAAFDIWDISRSNLDSQISA